MHALPALFPSVPFLVGWCRPLSEPSPLVSSLTRCPDLRKRPSAEPSSNDPNSSVWSLPLWRRRLRRKSSEVSGLLAREKQRPTRRRLQTQRLHRGIRPQEHRTQHWLRLSPKTAVCLSPNALPSTLPSWDGSRGPRLSLSSYEFPASKMKIIQNSTPN